MTSDAHAETYERAGRRDDAAEERPWLVALVGLHRGLVRMPRNGSNFPRAGSDGPLARGTISSVVGPRPERVRGGPRPCRRRRRQCPGGRSSGKVLPGRRHLGSGGSVSSLIMAPGLEVRDQSAGRRTRKHDGTTDPLKSPDLPRAPAAEFDDWQRATARRPPNAARCRSREEHDGLPSPPAKRATRPA